MRLTVIPIALLTALPALADELWAPSRVAAVTVYPGMAEISRTAGFDLPAGAHRLLLPGLPPGLRPETLEVSSDAAVRIGAVRIRDGRLPPFDPEPRPAIATARATLAAAEDALAAGRADRDALAGRIAAAEAQIAFLGRIGAGEGGAVAPPEALRDTVALIGAGMRAASDAIRAARAEIPAADRVVEDLVEKRDRAAAALAALVPVPPASARVLAVEVDAAAPVSGSLTLGYLTGGAEWAPSYRLHLDRAAGTLRVERLIGVAQRTGEDWLGVDLAVATGRSTEQTAASTVSPWLRRIHDAQMESVFRGDGGASRSLAPPPMLDEVQARPEPSVATVEARGMNFTWRFPGPVDLLTGAERAVLPMTEVTLDAEVVADAAPLRDATAFVAATVANGSGELLLPGAAALYLDGALVGETRLDALPPGGEAEIGFGPIEGLRLTRHVEGRSAGDRGVIRRSNDLVETAVIGVENLTGESWPVRLTDRVPYSEQEALKIDWTADPPPTEIGPDGRQGVLVWRFDIAPGETRRLTVARELTWPDGTTLD